MSSRTLVGEMSITSLLSTATSIYYYPLHLLEGIHFLLHPQGFRKGSNRSVTWPGAGTHCDNSESADDSDANFIGK